MYYTHVQRMGMYVLYTIQLAYGEPLIYTCCTHSSALYSSYCAIDYSLPKVAYPTVRFTKLGATRSATLQSELTSFTKMKLISLITVFFLLLFQFNYVNSKCLDYTYLYKGTCYLFLKPNHVREFQKSVWGKDSSAVETKGAAEQACQNLSKMTDIFHGNIMRNTFLL